MPENTTGISEMEIPTEMLMRRFVIRSAKLVRLRFHLRFLTDLRHQPQPKRSLYIEGAGFINCFVPDDWILTLSLY